MRIDLQYDPQTASEPNRTSASAPSIAGSSSAAASTAGAENQITDQIRDQSTDQAQLSGAHVSAEVLGQASQLPIREQKVQSLRQAVLSGQYQANPQNVAQALFSHMAVSKAA